VTEQTTGTGAAVRQLFDAKASGWSSKYGAGGRLTGRLAQLATAVQGQVPAGASVLDLGCGTGDLARYLARAGLLVTGCDISMEMLQRAARADPAGTVAWAALDPAWRILPFADGAFDVIVVSSVLEYVEEPIVVLRECARVLQSGGTLLCTIPDLRSPVRWLEWLAGIGARSPVAGALGRCQLRLNSYLTYLQLSRQRHSLRWWRTAGGHTALLWVALPTATSKRSPLRLLRFVKADC
jgi:SAM-dependent methyltransferase